MRVLPEKDKADKTNAWWLRHYDSHWRAKAELAAEKKEKNQETNEESDDETNDVAEYKRKKEVKKIPKDLTRSMYEAGAGLHFCKVLAEGGYGVVCLFVSYDENQNKTFWTVKRDIDKGPVANFFLGMEKEITSVSPYITANCSYVFDSVDIH